MSHRHGLCAIRIYNHERRHDTGDDRSRSDTSAGCSRRTSSRPTRSFSKRRKRCLHALLVVVVFVDDVCSHSHLGLLLLFCFDVRRRQLADRLLPAFNTNSGLSHHFATSTNDLI